MTAKTAPRLAAEKLVVDFPDTDSRTLAKRLAGEFNITLESARSHIRVSRGAMGDNHRKGRVVDRPLGKAGTKPKLPPSIAEPWIPFELHNSRRIGVISDLHIPYHSTMAVRKAIGRLKKFKPHAILINGDFCDFYSISRWVTNPAKRDMKKELTAVQQGLSWIREEFPNADIVFKKGNHEERWDHWLWNRAPEVSDMQQMQLEAWLDFDNLGITMVEDQRPVLCGKLPVFHGHELGKAMFSPVNPARGAFLRTHHTVLVSHSHQTSSHADTNLWHDETFVWSIGCLCDMNPAYARINRWNLGFAELEVANDKSFDVTNYRISGSGSVRKS